jgi:prophage regulatory protein
MIRFRTVSDTHGMRIWSPRKAADSSSRCDDWSMRFLKEKDVRQRVALSRTTIWRQVQAGTFPRPVRVGECAIAWIESEVDAWMKQRVKDRDRLAA